MISVLLLLLAVAAVHGDTIPQQLHLSLTGNVDEMKIGWITMDDTQTSVVLYWIDGQSHNMTATGQAYHYYLVDYESPALHYVTLTGLQPATKYAYIVGDPQGGWSGVNYFSSEKTQQNQPIFRIASIADNGHETNASKVVNAVLKYHEQVAPFDFLVHAGDISYANGYQSIWNDWGNMVEPLSSQLPWMTAVGNHEIFWAFVPFLWRFWMPYEQSGGTQGNLYWSFNYGPVHVISLTSEQLEYWHFDDQYEWVEKDLQSVNRTETPWIITLWHSPWYCSNKAHYNSGADMKASLEDLFYQYKVDLSLSGHVHAYERGTTIYNNKVDPNGPVYIVNGAGGTEEGLYNEWYDTPAWSMHKDGVHWGFGVIEIHNSTHLHWQFMDTDGNLQDETWIVRDR